MVPSDSTHTLAWPNSRMRIVQRIVLVIVIFAGSVYSVAATVVRDRLLTTGFYNSALADQHVYRRVYSQILTDPDVRATTNALVGEFELGGRDLADRVSLSNAVLRIALPPATLKRATEAVIASVVAYARGETDQLDDSIDLSSTLLQFNSTAETVLNQALANAASHVLTNLPAYSDAVRDFADQIATGSIPDTIPIFAGQAIDPAQIAEAVEAATSYGLPADVRDQVVAAIESGDQRDALITTASEYVRTYLQGAQALLSSSGHLRIDVVDALGRQAGQPQQQPLAKLNMIRDLAEWFPSWGTPFVLALVVLAVIGLLATTANRKTALVTIAVAFGAAAAVTAIGVRVIRLASPLSDAAQPGRTNDLPRSVIAMIDDVDVEMRTTLTNTINGRTIQLLIVAATFAALAIATVVYSRLRRTDRRTGRFLAGAAVLACLSVPALAAARPDSVTARSECNGHAELCDRPYDQIVQAATHNSMSSPDVVQIWPEHDANITAQLDAGIRTLLIDTSYWLEIDTPSELSTIELSLPPIVASFLFEELDNRLRAHPGTYLCHSRCAYGAISLVTALNDVKAFLDANPHEVVTLIIQNGISTSDTEAAFTTSGLDPYLYDGSTITTWPTLGQLIDTGQRLVVFAETGSPPPAWYHDARQLIQDTEYHVRTVAALDCDLKRGGAKADLFLLNHWIQREAPDRADAVDINQRTVIVNRAHACADQRGRLPNFIAVNFFTIGDVVGAVDELNGFDNSLIAFDDGFPSS